MPTRNVNLTEHFDRFVKHQIKAGRFRNASEVMRAGLRLLEQQSDEEQVKLQLLKSLAAEAFDQLDQGHGIEVTGRPQLDRLIHKIGQQASSNAKRSARGA